MMTLNTIRTALKGGVQPQDLPGAVRLGAGCFREAFKVGAFVVKERQYGQADPCQIREDLRPWKLRVAPTVFVFGRDCLGMETEYSIQPAYRPLHTVAGSYPQLSESPAAGAVGSWGDVHSGNVGLDHRNRFVAFDW